MVTIEDLQLDIARSVMNSTENEGWSLATLSYRAVASSAESDLYHEVGGQRLQADVPDDTTSYLRQLRREMATDNHGAWFVAEMTLKSNGEFEFTFDYDSEPNWDVAVGDDAYLADINKYPRPVGEIPAWHPARR